MSVSESGLACVLHAVNDIRLVCINLLQSGANVQRMLFTEIQLIQFS